MATLLICLGGKASVDGPTRGYIALFAVCSLVYSVLHQYMPLHLDAVIEELVLSR
jgi:biotin transporter BioY